MIKPVKRYGCDSEVMIGETRRGQRCVYLKSVSADIYVGVIIIYASTRLGAILHWNWKQWRARRAMKGDAKT